MFEQPVEHGAPGDLGPGNPLKVLVDEELPAEEETTKKVGQPVQETADKTGTDGNPSRPSLSTDPHRWAPGNIDREFEELDIGQGGKGIKS